MIRIQQLKLPVTHTQEELEQKIRKTLKIGKHDLQEIELLRRSIDARKKSELKYVYQLDVKVKDENAVLRKAKNNQIVKAEKKPYVFPKSGEQTLVHRPVIIGSGPAGLFCAYVLAKHGYRPLVLERGESAEQRKKSVDAFWKTGVLNPESNVQFGEGGAGTFSDGKLNTAIKDPTGRIHEVLRIFAEFGADSRILYVNKPHIGTDVLAKVVQNIRKKITACGGEVHFQTKLTALPSLTVQKTNPSPTPVIPSVLQSVTVPEIPLKCFWHRESPCSRRLSRSVCAWNTRSPLSIRMRMATATINCLLPIIK